METTFQLYIDETEDMLQSAEECLIRLEAEYSSDEINELFRIAHTIKGSSHMVGYEDIGNLMHKIEDMLDSVRSGSIRFDPNIVSISFKGLDIVKKMLQSKKEHGTTEMAGDFQQDALQIQAMIEKMIKSRPQEEKNHAKQRAGGIVSSLINPNPKSKNRYYITFFVDEDAPMVSPVFMMILKSIKQIGTLLYCSISDSYFSESSDDDIKTMDIILCTDIEEAELYTYFAMFYVEKINIVDLSRNKLEQNDYYFNEQGNNIACYIHILRIFINLYHLLFTPSQKTKINKKELNNIKSLYGEAVELFETIKNKSQFRTFINDFNEVFTVILNMINGQGNVDEDCYTTLRIQLLQLLERAYHFIKGKYLVRVIKPDKENFINRLENFMEMVHKSTTLLIFIDLSELEILNENEVKVLINLKNEMEAKGIQIGIIADGPFVRRVMNIFDAITPIVEFHLFPSELDALVGMFHSQFLFERVNQMVKELEAG